MSIVVGAGLVVLAVGLSLFDRTHAADRMTSSVRPAMNKPFLGKVTAAFGEVMSGIDELQTKVYPAVAQRLGQTPQQFEAQTAAKYPTVETGVRRRQEIIDRYSPFVPTLDAHISDFHAADTLPVSWLPMTAGAWGSLVLGLAFVVIGVLILTVRSATPLLLSAVLGLVAVVGPVGASFPQKASQTGDLVDALRPYMSRAALAQYEADLKLAREFVAELRDRFLPDTAAQLHMARSDFDALIASAAPATAKAIPDLDTFLGVAGLLLGQKLPVDVPYFQKAKRIPIKVLPWVVIIPGGLVAAVSLGALGSARRSKEQQADAPDRTLVGAASAAD